MRTQLPDFTKASVLVVGDVMLDRYWFGDTSRISPEAPVPVVKVNQIDERPGGAGNVALNIAALGAKVSLLGISGDDDAAGQLEKQLTEANVTHHILKVANARTIAKLRIISRHQQLIRLDFEERFPPFNPELFFKLYEEQLLKANLVILSDYGKGTLTHTQELIQRAKKAGIPIFVDPKGLDFSIYQGATAITPNYKEFEAIAGPCQTEQEITVKAHQFLSQQSIDALLLTRGERGMTLIQKNAEEMHLPAHAREVFDVTGAGDTVIAVLGAAKAAGATLIDAMTLANLSASLVVAKLGAASISKPELHAALNDTLHATAGILNEEQLLQAIAKARINGQRIVFTNGCFDILHAGHVTYLQQAKQLGDFLIVAINSDDSVTRLKGPHRPVNNEQQRKTVLASLGAVDWVTSFSEDTPERLLKLLQPDILVKGGDYQPHEVVGAEIVLAYGGEVRVLGLVKDLSTTSIIDRMVKHQTTSQVE